jgi:hypothetical protein
MAALRATSIEMISLAGAVARVRRVPVEEYERFGALFGVSAHNPAVTVAWRGTYLTMLTPVAISVSTRCPR